MLVRLDEASAAAPGAVATAAAALGPALSFGVFVTFDDTAAPLGGWASAALSFGKSPSAPEAEAGAPEEAGSARARFLPPAPPSLALPLPAAEPTAKVEVS